jgi:peptidoglycan/LPS O-acetylase OafA/YrhL
MLQNAHPRLTRNNFDLLRLLFAAIVCVDHSYILSGFQSLQPIATLFDSRMTVKAFFVVSGFLIFMSYERSTSLTSYASKRFRRIYPAYFTVVMLCAICLAAVSSKSLGDYFSWAWIKYVAANLAFLNFVQPSLPGVFGSNIEPFVNGALWTIKIEVMFYLSVPFFVFLIRKFRPFPILVGVYCLSVAYSVLLSIAARRTGNAMYDLLDHQLPGQLSYFMAGAFFYYFLPLFERRTGYFLAVAVSIFLINRGYPLPLFIPFALATLVLFFGLFLYVGNVGKYGDFSYGFYILHFPIIQFLLNTGWFRESPWSYFATVIFMATTGSMAMWHLVEKRFLLRNSHYVAALHPLKV